MANPIVGKEMELQLAHCTAPLSFAGNGRAYDLRSHHESGIGVSPAVEMGVGESVTLCRMSAEQGMMSSFCGITRPMRKRPTCRTGIGVQLDNMSGFMDTLLGLHQSLVYGQWCAELALCAEMLDLEYAGERKPVSSFS